MKKLIISLKSPREALTDFAKALKKAQKNKGKVQPHYEISFDNKRDFNRFVKNISVLMWIRTLKPKSVYELSKVMKVDQSNLNKLILFFENIGAIEIKERNFKGRLIRTPVLKYDRVEFNLKAA